MAAVLGLVVHAVKACHLHHGHTVRQAVTQETESLGGEGSLGIWFMLALSDRFRACRIGFQYLLSLCNFLRLDLQGLAEGDLLKGSSR